MLLLLVALWFILKSSWFIQVKGLIANGCQSSSTEAQWERMPSQPLTKGLSPLLPNQGLIRDLPQLPRPPAHKTNYFDKKKPSIANSTLPPISSNDPRPLLQGLPPSPTCLHAPPPPCQLPGPTRFRSNPDHHAHADNGLVLNCIRIFTDYFAFIQISTQIRGAPILNGIPCRLEK